LTLGGWLVPNFKNEDGDPDASKAKCPDDDPDAVYSCIRECGKLPLVGGPIAIFALPFYLFCKAMIILWLYDNVLVPCLRAMWRCLLALYYKVLAPCLAWLCAKLAYCTGTCQVKVQILADQSSFPRSSSDSSDSDHSGDSD
jgi:hypothetical protein